MSFFGRENDAQNAPGAVLQRNNGRCSESVCVEVFKIFDCAMLQKHQNDQILEICEAAQDERTPLEYLSARLVSSVGVLTNVQVREFPDRSRFSRLTADLIVPIEIFYIDADGKEHRGCSTYKIPFDIVLHVPRNAHIGVEFKASISAIVLQGKWVEANKFAVNLCVNTVIKCGAYVDLVLPSFGYSSPPQAINYQENVCGGFFEQPLNPV